MTDAPVGGVMWLVMLGCWEGVGSGWRWLAIVGVFLLVAGGSWAAGAIGRRLSAEPANPAEARWPDLSGRDSVDGPDDRDWPHSRTTLPGVPPDSPAADGGPDIHLVMNTFNRLAGDVRYDEDDVAAAPIFALSDYLRQCLVHAAPTQVALHEEIDMLESYLRLAAIFHGCDLQASVELAPGSGDVRLQAHSICLVAQVLLAGLSAESPGRFVLPVRVQGLAAGGVDVDMALRLQPRPPNTYLRQMREELQKLGAAMSRHSVRWSCRVVRDRHSDISVSLRIRPRPAH
ncbi:hypothetical protein GN316_15690 [Xylophilus sp. Kf1]|nr:hypothetical protein [Xylophilus sp. Kf1]